MICGEAKKTGQKWEMNVEAQFFWTIHGDASRKRDKFDDRVFDWNNLLHLCTYVYNVILCVVARECQRPIAISVCVWATSYKLALNDKYIYVWYSTKRRQAKKEREIHPYMIFIKFGIYGIRGQPTNEPTNQRRKKYEKKKEATAERVSDSSSRETANDKKLNRLNSMAYYSNTNTHTHT